MAQANPTPHPPPARGPSRLPPFRFFLPVFCLGAFLPQTGWAVRPMSCAIALVAGEGTPGFQDGAFTSAFFKRPLGLAASSDGTRLFVADSGNNRIRVIHLDQNNGVTTLTGKDQPGKEDGPLASARFKDPRAVVALPDERLVVYDFGNKRLRLVDLKQGTVSTLAGSSPTTLAEGPASIISMDGIRDMAYLPQADSLFFTQPEKAALKRLDLKTGRVLSVPLGPGGLGRPDALCADQGRLYVDVNEQSQVFAFDWKEGTLSGPVSAATTRGSILSLVKSGDYLYALQGGESPLQRLLPVNEPVSFTSVWGDDIPDPANWLASFNNQLGLWLPVGFVSDPGEARKLYVVNPNSNIITCFRDLYGNQDVNGNPSTVEPPLKKPPHTFRIMLVGDSRSDMIVNYQFPTSYNVQGRPLYPAQVSLTRRLELELNTLAALDDTPLNFEIIKYSDSGSIPLFLWPYYRVPAIAQKEDVDLVIIMQAPTSSDQFPFKFYFLRPITPEGIPAATNDIEYLLKPPAPRIPDGAPREFYDLCKARHFVYIKGNNFVFNDGLFSDPEIHGPLVEMYGKPLGLLNQKLSAMKTSTGQPVKLLLWSTRTGLSRPNGEDPRIWADAAKKFQVPFLDNNDQMTALVLSYFPISEIGGSNHMNPDGHALLARILAHDLIKSGLIPWAGTSPALTASPRPTTGP
ncbi:MAG TPA: hypothetical protein VK859_08175 [bacterium]|nr:hypothetical protein [bacterium]